jgi:hypothetical protein
MGLECENAIQRAFATMGFGTWRQLLPATIKRKSKNGHLSDRPLIDTEALRMSITSKVERRG